MPHTRPVSAPTGVTDTRSTGVQRVFCWVHPHRSHQCSVSQGFRGSIAGCPFFFRAGTSVRRYFVFSEYREIPPSTQGCALIGIARDGTKYYTPGWVFCRRNLDRLAHTLFVFQLVVIALCRCDRARRYVTRGTSSTVACKNQWVTLQAFC